MSLNSKDKGLVRVGWAMVQRRSEQVGIEAISRMFFTLPQTKSYFAHWGGDLSPKSPHVKKQAIKIMGAITSAVANMDTLDEDMLALSEQHAFQLRVDPVNFKFLIFNLHLTIAKSFPDEFTPVMHLALDKFLNLVALALSDKYR